MLTAQNLLRRGGGFGRPHLCALLWVFGSIPVSTLAATLVVPEDFATIQGAIDAASDGDEILVGPGLYAENLVIRTGVHLIGPGIDGPTAHIQGTRTGSVVTFDGAPQAGLEGFELSGSGVAETDALILVEGSSPEIRNSLLSGPGPNGVYATSDSDPHIDGNRFQALARAITLEAGSDPDITGNEFSYGSGVAIVVGQGCSPLIQDNTFHDNDGDIVCEASNAPWIFGNLFEATRTDAVLLTSTSPTLSDNTFRGVLGTALRVEAAAYPDVLQNWFDGNATAVRIEASSPTVAGNWFTRTTGTATRVGPNAYPTIYQNIYQDNHDAIVLEGSADAGDASPHILNNTIVAGTGAGIRCVDLAFPAISNNIVAYNDDYGIVCQGSSLPTLAYNDVYGNTPDEFGGTCGFSDTDMSVDPEFVAFTDDRNPDNDDLHTEPDSPTRDAGNPYAEYDDPDGSRNDVGAYGGPPDPAFVDIDGDGYRTEDGDCNDADPRIHPDAEEVVDGVDNDCDGVVDFGTGDDDATGTSATPTNHAQTPVVNPTPAEDDDVTWGSPGPEADDDSGTPPALSDTPAGVDDDSSPEGDGTETPVASPGSTSPQDEGAGGDGCSCRQPAGSMPPGGTAAGLLGLALAHVGTRRRGHRGKVR